MKLVPSEKRTGSPKPQVALFLADLAGGGAERMMVNLARGFADQGLMVDMVLAAARGPYLDEVPRTVNLIDLATGGASKSVFKLARYLRQSCPEVLLTTLRHSSIVALWATKLAGVSTRVFVREANMVTFDQTGGFKGRFMPFLVRHTYRRAEGIIAVSQGVAVDIVRFTGISKERVHTLYNPVVTPEIGERAREPVDHPWFKPGASPVILGAGSLSVQKDFDTLVRAFALLRQSQEAKLIILGEGKRRRELEKVIHQLNLGADVELPGFVPNPFAYMGKAALFVLSSRWEGLPGVLIQAMACGCPVVSTDCPSGPREILDAGRYGLLVEVGDVPGLARAMQETLTTPLSGELLQRRARQFSASEVIPKYMDVLFAHKPLSQHNYIRGSGG